MKNISAKLLVKKTHLSMKILLILSFLILGSTCDYMINSEPISKLDLYGLDGKKISGKHLDLTEGTWYVVPDNLNFQNECLEFHPNGQFFISNAMTSVINYQSYMDVNKRVLTFFCDTDTPPLFKQSVLNEEAMETNSDIDKVNKLFNDLFNKTPEMVESWNKIALADIPGGFWSQAHKMLDFQKKIKKFLDSGTKTERLEKYEFKDEENFDEYVYTGMIKFLTKKIFKSIVEKGSSDPNIKIMQARISEELDDYSYQFFIDLISTYDNTKPTFKLFDDLKELIYFFINKRLRYFYFENKYFLNFLFVDLEKYENTSDSNLHSLFVNNITPKNVMAFLNKKLNTEIIVFEEGIDDDIKHFYFEQQEQLKLKAEENPDLEIQIEELSEDEIPGHYYIDAAKQKLFEIVRDLGDLLKPMIIEYFNPTNQDGSEWEQHVEDPNSIPVNLDFNYLEDPTKNYEQLLNEMINEIDKKYQLNFIHKYNMMVECSFYLMSEVLDQNFDVDKLRGDDYKELYHLRRTLVEVGEIDFRVKTDLKGLKPFKYDIFVQKRLNLI